MIFNKNKCYKLFFLLLMIGLNIPLAFPYSNFLSSLPSSLEKGYAIVQLGGYWSNQGHAQHINIQGLIGDQFTVTSHNGSNGLVGLGYFLNGQDRSFIKISYGINAFYLPRITIRGNVIQEDLFTNLSYQYNLTHYPVYATVKSTIDTKCPKYALTIDAGIGPNFMRADGFQEHSLNGITIPDNIFSSHTSTVFSATVGFGVKMNHVFGPAPLECGYRFFYLGQGNLKVSSNQTLNTLNTGSVYANALNCSIAV